MHSPYLYALDILAALAATNTVYVFIQGLDPVQSSWLGNLGVGGRLTQLLGFWSGTILYRLMRSKWYTPKEKVSMYGLQHGRLHLQVSTAMWMNMGYWENSTPSTTLSLACRDLLKVILAEAGISDAERGGGVGKGRRRRRCLIDLGFGCGDQTVYLMSKEPIRSCDRDWWDERECCPTFDHYIGITKDKVQACYALDRIDELRKSQEPDEKSPAISLFNGDAANPVSWNQQLRANIQAAKEDSEERWVLALDTAYHFAPARWPIIKYAYSELGASFMAFDLCLSPTATLAQKIMLRSLTALMGAPWANFVTPEEYHSQLVKVGYKHDKIIITDISEHVFGPLATFLAEQDKRLKSLGLGLGSLGVARTMFGWWGRTGVVRGVIVVARHE